MVLESEGGLVSETLLIEGVVSNSGMTTYVPKDALFASGIACIMKMRLGVEMHISSFNFY